jgi:hypothetical protein
MDDQQGAWREQGEKERQRREKSQCASPMSGSKRERECECRRELVQIKKKSSANRLSTGCLIETARLFGKIEVGQHDVARIVKEDVLRLEVSAIPAENRKRLTRGL